jgi:hypothetical protein
MFSVFQPFHNSDILWDFSIPISEGATDFHKGTLLTISIHQNNINSKNVYFSIIYKEGTFKNSTFSYISEKEKIIKASLKKLAFHE